MHNMKCILWELYFFYRVYSFHSVHLKTYSFHLEMQFLQKKPCVYQKKVVTLQPILHYE